MATTTVASSFRIVSAPVVSSVQRFSLASGIECQSVSSLSCGALGQRLTRVSRSEPQNSRRSMFKFGGKKGAQASAAASSETIYDFTVQDIDGKDVSLTDFKGKVALIVNVASACGLTKSNYTELTQVYNAYKDQGFVVLAFPSNQFGAQEPGDNAQIKEFACSRYKADFPLFSKIDVNGPNTAPLYEFLKVKKGGGILGSDIKWNFGKFLVDRNGNVVERYAPTTSPKSIEADIKKLL